MSEAGVHRPHVGGIHGRSNDGSYSLVLAGGFEDEVVGYLYYLQDVYSHKWSTDSSSNFSQSHYYITVNCCRTGEMSSPTQAAGAVTSQETNGSESTVLTRPLPT